MNRSRRIAPVSCVVPSRSRLAPAYAAALAAFALATTACDDGSGPQTNITRVEVNIASPTLLVETSALATARAFDLNGELITGRSVRWRAAPATVLRISDEGVYTGLVLGTATITATIGGVSGTATVTVVPLPVASIEVNVPSVTLERGQSSQLRATLRDQFGEVLEGRSVTWTSSAPGIAAVSGNGLVTAIAAGTAEITVSSEDQSVTVPVTVIVQPVDGGPRITSIEPALLVPGGTATITGEDFGETTDANEVRVAGVIVTILGASATELTVQLPLGGFGCNPTREVFVQVARGPVADARAHPLQSLPLRTLAPGESLVFSNAADAACFELATTGGRYILSVYNTGTQVGADAGFRLRGIQGLAVPGDPLPVAATRAPIPAPLPLSPSPSLPALFASASERNHLRIMEANSAALRRRSPMDEPPAARPLASAVAAQTVGAVLPFRIPNVGGFLSGGLDFCTNFFSVSARVVYNGARAIVVEDVATTTPDGSPTLAGQMDSLYVKLGQEFDELMFNIVRNNFADPLRMDDLLDNNGKIVMLFSPRINTFSGIAGFVVTCDFNTRETNPSSNHAEVFYARVPLSTAAGFGSNPETRSQWYRTIRSTVVHEVKHIAAFANRIRDFGSSLEESWLEEGLARHAEEIWARTAAYGGLQQRANATYEQTVFCDVFAPSRPECAGAPLAMYRHFADNGLYDYLRDNELRSPLGPKTGIADGSFYATAWSLVRWAADNHPGDEPALFGALVRTGQSGVTNLTARLGRPWEDILGEWSLALYVDDLADVIPQNPRLGFPSWNLRSIYLGLHEDFRGVGAFTLPYPLVPRTAIYGDFTHSVTKVAGGSFSMFNLSGGQTGRQLIRLLGLTTEAPSNRLRVAIIRIE